MSSPTQELLRAGGFSYTCHPDLVDDIKNAQEEDASCWVDMRVTLERVRSGSCRSDDWAAPLMRKHADIGEIKRQIEERLYRLYVHAPRHQPGVLYLLHFAWKRPGRPGLEAQDRQIDEAFNRLMSHPPT